MSYLVDRELQLPFGAWVEAIRAARNHMRRRITWPRPARFDWLDMGDHPVVAGIPEE